MIVVSDTSPLRCLGQLGLLATLPEVFQTLIVPPAVVRELSARSPLVSIPIDLSKYPHFEIRTPTNDQLLARLLARLHQGEAEALTLAVECRIKVMLIDELTGRRDAKSLGLVPMGVLGALVELKRAGMVHTMGPLILRLKQEFQFRVSTPVEEQVLGLAGA